MLEESARLALFLEACSYFRLQTMLAILFRVFNFLKGKLETSNAKRLESILKKSVIYYLKIILVDKFW